ncbi:MAG TPA: LuxR C-terminal-related transcriptional regulator [Rubrobacter sp.]|nr:LuxR C-terminal-related transcriptional regulator [Rubrobacter sp.]
MGEFSAMPEHGRLRDNLPLQLTSFVGREREMAEVATMLQEHRLLTLTGPGGSGKTRLALAVASRAVEGYSDGVWLAELAPLSDPDLVPQAVASVLDVREVSGTLLVDSLRTQIGSREILLILDNCEHVIDACASLAEGLLGHCQNLRILATSREVLGIVGETLFAVPPLSLPDPRRLPSPESLTSYEAARLFVERARAVRPDFELTGDNAMAVAQICYRLDGIPLAIELAAARVRVLSVGQISTRLDESFRFLTVSGRTALARQRTLAATIDWSHELLSEREKVLFRRLSVFAGGWTLEAAEAVCNGEGVEREDVLDLLASLVDKSLVLVEKREAAIRYRLLETVRQYGWELLKESGEVPATQHAHGRYFLQLAEESEPELRGGQQGRWIEYLDEHDNFRAAISWSLEHGEAGLGLRLAASLGEFWYLSGHLEEGRRWLEAALAQGGGEPEAVRVKALTWAGAMRWITRDQADYERLVDNGEEALALSRELGNQSDVALALQTLSYAESQRNHLERASRLAEQAIELQRASADTGGIARSLPVLGFVALGRHDHERAVVIFEESIVLAREARDNFAIAVNLIQGALAYSGVGDHARASTLCHEGIRLTWELEMMPLVSGLLNVSAVLASVRGQPTEAARLWGAAESLRESLNISLAPIERSYYDPPIEAARLRVDGATWAAARAEGRAMSTEQAVEHALQEQMPEEPTIPDDYPAGLSAREVEVLSLLATGLTNAQIASKLFISPRTVNAHLGSIYHKIGSSTRAQAARFAAEQGLL